MKQANIETVWPLLAVKDLPRSLAFWRDQLGFAVVEEAGEDGEMFWCRIEREGASLMLQSSGEASKQRGHGVTLYFLVDDAMAMFEELVAKGLQLTPPERAPYPMLQLHVPEPDGYEVVFESRT